MLQRLLSTVLAAAVVVTSSVPVAAQPYIFRYKYPMTAAYVPEVPEAPVEEIAPENDIDAHYVAVLGRPFAKTLPVATRDVVEWRIEEGDTVPGLAFDADTGSYGGSATDVVEAEHVAYGYDSRGVRIARAEVHFWVFQPQGVRAEIDFYAHTGHYFFETIPTPDGVDVFRWEPFAGAAPGMASRANAFEGTPTEEGTFPLAYQGFDYFGEPVAYAEGQILVEDGPQVAEIDGQTINKQRNEVFDRQAVVARSIGSLSYRLVPTGDRPAGLTFDSLTGKVGGAYDAFETSASFKIEVTDNADGTKGESNEFELTTEPADLDPSAMRPLYGTVGQPFGPYRLTAALNLPGTTWTVVQGSLPAGLRIDADPDTGAPILTGTPQKRETQSGIVLEIAAPGVDPKQTNEFTITINEQGFSPYTATFHGRTGQPITTDGVCLTGKPRDGVCAPPLGTDVYEYRLLSDLPDGFSYDSTTGVLSNAAGLSEPASFTLTLQAFVGDEARSSTFTQRVDIRSPLTLAYNIPADPYVRKESKNLFPTYDTSALVGSPKFEIVSGTLPADGWLAFNKTSGVFSVRPTLESHIGRYDFTVSLTDDIGPKTTSASFTIEVVDRRDPEPVLGFTEIERLVGNTRYRFAWAKNLFAASQGGSYSFRLVDGRGVLPPGLTLRSDGYLLGTTSAAAGSVWPDIVIEATDQVAGERAYVGTNADAPFTLTVVEPKALGSLDGSFDKVFEWPVNRPMSYAMPRLVGALGKVTYTLTGQALDDLVINGDKLEGTVTDVGEYALTYTVKDDTVRPENSGTITLKIVPQMTVTAEPYWDAYKSSWFSKAPEVINGIAPIRYEFLPSSQLPASRDWRVSGGTVSGMPMEDAGEYPVSIRVTDAAGVIRTFDTILRLNAPKDFTFAYTTTRLNVGRGGNPLFSPKVTNGRAPFTYSMVSGDIPGLTLRTAGDQYGRYAGSFSGTPTTPGVYEIAVTATDANGLTPKPDDPVKHEVLVGYDRAMDFRNATFTRRAGKRFDIALPVSYAVFPSYAATTAPLAHGLTVDGPTGILSGTIADVGSFGGIDVTVTEDARFKQDPASATFTVVTKGDLVFEVPATMSFTQYQQKAVGITKAENVIGTASYVEDPTATPLPAGLSVNPQTGAVEGVPTVPGTTTGHRIVMTDTYGTTPADADSKPSNLFDITVDERPPLDLSYDLSKTKFQQYKSGEAKPTVSSAAPGEVVYSVDRPLPAGLALTDDGRIVATDPAEAFAEETFTVTAKDATGVAGDVNGIDTFEAKVSIERRPQLDAGFEAPVSFKRHIDGQASATTANDEAYGTLEYSVVSGAPSDIAFSGSSLGGTTTAPAGTYTVRVRATDDTYRTHGDALGMLEFDVTVEVEDRPDLDVSLGDEPVVFAQYEDREAAVTVEEDLGPITYTVNPPLPANVAFDGKRLVATGPVDALPLTTFSVRAEDGKDGISDFTFDLQVLRRPEMVFSYGQPIVHVQHRADTGVAPAAAAPAYGSVEYSVSPTPPSCITFNETNGTFGTTGCPTKLDKVTFTVTATDATFRDHGDSRGRKSAPVDVSVRERDPMTLSYEDYDEAAQTFGFQRHKTETVLPKPVGQLTSMTWGIHPALPDGLVFDYDTGSITAETASIIPAADYTVTVEDDKDGHAEAKLRIGVREREQIAFTTDTDQPVLLNNAYDLTLSVEKEITDADPTTPDLFYTLVSGDLPSGIGFDAVGTDGRAAGTFHGTPDAADHGKSFTVKIRVTDAFDGYAEEEFTFTVVEDATPITLTYADPGRFRVGYAASIPAPALTDTIGNFSFAAPDLAQYGLAIDARTGAVSGIPNGVFEADVTVTVTDKVRSAEATLHLVSVPSPRVEIDGTIPALYNRDIDPATFVEAFDTEGAQVWTISPDLPKGITLDPATGAFLGQPEVIGDFGPYTLTLTDSLPGTFPSAPFFLDIEMNDDPIEMASPVILTKVGFDVAVTVPEYDNEYGAPRFSSPELAAFGLSIHPVTGEITGQVNRAVKDQPNVVIRDDTQRTTTVPVDLTVLPRMVLVAPASFNVNAQEAMTPVKVTPQAVAGTVTWEAVDPSLLPPGMTFDTSTGQFEGTPEVIGTWGPFRVAAVDTFGHAGLTDRAESNDITINVRKGSLYVNLMDQPLPVATKRAAYSFDLRTLVDPQSQGVDPSELSWTVADLPGGLSATAEGLVSGAPALSGTYDVTVTASFNGRDWSRVYPLQVKLPDASLTLAAAEGNLPTAERAVTGEDHSYSYDLTPLLTHPNIPLSDVTWTVEPAATGEAFPDGLSVSGGTISGTATSAEGLYTFRVTARYVNGTDEDYSSTMSYTVRVRDTVQFGLAAVQEPLPGKKRLAFAHDFSQYLTGVSGFDPAKLVWSMAVNPARDPDTTRDDVPAGLAFEGSVLKGTFVNSGNYDIVVTASYDGRDESTQATIGVGLLVATIDLGNDRNLDLALLAPANIQLGQDITLKNIPADQLVYSLTPSGGTIPGLTFDTKTGILSGIPTSKGTFEYTLTATFKDKADQPEDYSDSAVVIINVDTDEIVFASVTVSSEGTCGLNTEGAIFCWGRGSGIEFANGPSQLSTSILKLPTEMTHLGSGWKKIERSANHRHTCAISSNDELFCWGANLDGQLGIGTLVNSYVPAKVEGLGSVVDVALGTAFACAITSDQKTFCWGQGGRGQLGNGLKESSTTPVEVVGIPEGLVKLSAGQTHVCGITTLGAAKCWGQGSSGQLGLGSIITADVPTQVTGLHSGIVDVSAGHSTTCAVTENGGAKCWGLNNNGQLGNGTTTRSNVPVDVTISGVRTISVGGYLGNSGTTCAVLNTGNVKCWGSDSRGNAWVEGYGLRGIGQATRTDALVPNEDVLFVDDAISIDMNSHACVTTAKGEIWCWGYDEYSNAGNAGNAGKYGNGRIWPVLAGGT